MNKKICRLLTSFIILLNCTVLFADQINTMEVKGSLLTDTLKVDIILSDNPNKKIFVLDTFLLASLKSANAVDSIVTVDPITGQLRRRNAASMGVGVGTNIYNSDGTLTGNRTVTMSNNNINFTGGRIGLGNPNPLGLLHLDYGAANRKLILYQKVNNDHEFYGFGIGANILRYQVSSAGGGHVFYSGINATSSKELLRIQGNGNVGIGNADPWGPLHFENTFVNRKLILYQTINNDHQFYGFGVNSGVLRYQVGSLGGSHIFYSGIDANGSKELMRIQGDGKILIPTLASTNATDSIVMVDPTTGELRRRDASKLSNNIYNVDGTLTGNRTVSMNGNNIIFIGGNIGIGNANPWGLLHFASTFVNRKIIFSQTINNDHQFYGFGVNSGVLRYQVDGPTISHIFYSGVDANSSKALMRIQGDGKILIPTLASANATDSIVMVDPTTGELRRKDASEIIGGSTSIYDGDGTLTGNRTVTMAGKNLNFTGGNIGIGNANPWGPLHFASTFVNRKIIFSQTINNDHQFYGLGINSNILRYQVEAPTSSHIFYSGIDANSSKELMRIQGDGKILIPTLASANATDSVVIVDPTTGELRRKNALNVGSNIYMNHGTLMGNRTVTMAGKSLNFAEGKIGINNDEPLGALHFDNTNGNRKIILYQTINNEHQFFGFGVNSNILRYQVGGVTSSHVFYGGVDANSSKELMRIQGDGKIFIPSLTSANTSAGSGVTDSLVMIDPATGELRRKDATKVRNNNIYTINGTLTGNRIVTMAGKSLNFSGGNIGIGHKDYGNIFGPLQFYVESENRKIILYQNPYTNDDHQFYGFGISVSNDALKYQVANQDAAHVFYAAIDGNSSKELMRIKGNAHTLNGNVSVGIGTDNPRAPLHIMKSVNSRLDYEVASYFDYLPDRSGTTITSRRSTTPLNISIAASGAIIGGQQIAVALNTVFSDKRIKKDISLSDSKLDLNILNKIKVSNYKLIDFLDKGNGTHKKVIAQELEQVYPQAVQNITNHIPNVYQISDSIIYLSDTLALISFSKSLDSECVAGRGIRFHNEEGKEMSGFIKEVKEKSLVISQVPKNQKGIFVYGVEVNNFKSVDYNAIAMLNVSATQEVYKTMITQESTIQQLESTIQQLHAIMQEQEKQLEKALKLMKDKLAK